MNDRTKTILLIAGGVAIGLALPVIIPAVVEGGRPLAKALLKHGSIALQRLQVLAARAAETVDDLLAEVRAEAQPAVAQVQETIKDVANDLPVADKKVLS
jgi:polyhydroxyalkanoate synthesis regulator phasin